jgi:hypothetical protein
MNQTTKYLIASLSCLILFLLLAFMGNPGIVFQSVWAEIFVASLLFAGSGIFLYAAFDKKE